MPQKQCPPRWSPEDNSKLLRLLQERKIDTVDLSFKAIEATRAEHFPHASSKNYPPLFRKKVRKWNIEQTLSGKRDKTGNLPLFLVSMHWQLFLSNHSPPLCTLAASKNNVEAKQRANTGAVGAPKRVQVEDDESSEDDEDLDEGEVEDNEIDREEDIDEEVVDDLAEELDTLDVADGAETSTDLMKPLVYAWFDEVGRQHLTLDFLVVCLPEGDFTPRVTRNGMGLELGFKIPEIFFSPTRLTSASEGRVTGTHHKHTAFTKAVHDSKTSMGGYDAPMIVWQKVKLPFKVELDFCSLNNSSPGFELVAFPHPNRDLRRASQNLFIFTVELVSVVKPRNITPINRGDKAAFRMVSSPAGDEENSNNGRDDEVDVDLDHHMGM